MGAEDEDGHRRHDRGGGDVLIPGTEARVRPLVVLEDLALTEPAWPDPPDTATEGTS
jgi:hypothetical protein